MTITTTLGQLAAARLALDALIALKLDAKTKYHATKLAKLVRAEVTDHFDDAGKAIWRELGQEREATPDEQRANPNMLKVLEVPKEKLDELSRRLAELADVEVTIPWGPMTSTMLAEVAEFTGDQWLALGPLFEFVENDAQKPAVP